MTYFNSSNFNIDSKISPPIINYLEYYYITCFLQTKDLILHHRKTEWYLGSVDPPCHKESFFHVNNVLQYFEFNLNEHYGL